MVSIEDTGKDIFLCSILVRLHAPRSRLLHFPNSVNAIPRLNAFKKKRQMFLPRIYINRENILLKAKEETREITANVKRLRKVFGACGGFVLEIEWIIEESRWRCALPVLMVEECGWYWIKNHGHLLEVQLKILYFT